MSVRAALLRWTVVLGLLLAVVVAVQAAGGSRVDATEAEPDDSTAPGEAGEAGRPDAPEVADGRRLFQRDCVICHGPEGQGTERAPSIVDDGTASVHFMLTSGYMPLIDPYTPRGDDAPPDQRMRRREPAYSPEQIDAIVAYAATIVEGPEIPEVDASEDRVAKGGRLYRLHCAACHQMIGTGGVLVDRKYAPTLAHASAVETVEVLRTGPGTMPKYSEEQISPEEADAIAAYVVHVIQQPQDPGGFGFGHLGPFSEGAVAWFLGIAALLGISLWIGERT